ncbi:hypothetical protein PQX77_012850 [Marasmius sp. AFHP31]|nr:hypothetical protein PQX77_012850 [Marasmius sp. AFHP31]
MPNERRRSPWQLKEGEYPEGAKQTKKAFEVDLCALMKLMKVNSLPDKPSDNEKDIQTTTYGGSAWGWMAWWFETKRLIRDKKQTSILSEDKTP